MGNCSHLYLTLFCLFGFFGGFLFKCLKLNLNFVIDYTITLDTPLIMCSEVNFPMKTKKGDKRV